MEIEVILSFSLSIGQKTVMTVICWMGMAALRNVTRRWASTVMVSESYSLECRKKQVSFFKDILLQLSHGVSQKQENNNYISIT